MLELIFRLLPALTLYRVRMVISNCLGISLSLSRFLIFSLIKYSCNYFRVLYSTGLQPWVPVFIQQICIRLTLKVHKALSLFSPDRGNHLSLFH